MAIAEVIRSKQKQFLMVVAAAAAIVGAVLLALLTSGGQEQAPSASRGVTAVRPVTASSPAFDPRDLQRTGEWVVATLQPVRQAETTRNSFQSRAAWEEANQKLQSTMVGQQVYWALKVISVRDKDKLVFLDGYTWPLTVSSDPGFGPLYVKLRIGRDISEAEARKLVAGQQVRIQARIAELVINTNEDAHAYLEDVKLVR